MGIQTQVHYIIFLLKNVWLEIKERVRAFKIDVQYFQVAQRIKRSGGKLGQAEFVQASALSTEIKRV